jgi:hypothetical protein
MVSARPGARRQALRATQANARSIQAAVIDDAHMLTVAAQNAF